MDELAEYLNGLNESEDFKRGFMEAIDRANETLAFKIARDKCVEVIHDALHHFNDDHDVIWLAWSITFTNILAGMHDYTQTDIVEAMKHVESIVEQSPAEEIIRRYM